MAVSVTSPHRRTEDDVERTQTGRGPEPMIGRVLDGRYRVGPKIARGGMAVVYEAVDLRLDRTVAIKVMHAGLAEDEEFVGRFEREARSAARLSHPNVVSVYDQGEDRSLAGDTLFLVMEYVPGLTLRDLIRKEAPIPAAKALALLEPVLAALSAAHAAGVVHRDIKPENVLLADDGRIKVADFGLARAVNSETQHTATGGVLIGTVSYLSPELVVNGSADARADVYAAGVILYELLTGAKPHQADSPIQVAYKHVHEDVPAPSATVPGIPAYVDALVARATARDQSVRPADARVLLHQVRRVRSALDHGVADDQELVDDLTPTAPVHDPDGALPHRIVDPGSAAAAATLLAQGTRPSVAGPTSFVGEAEHEAGHEAGHTDVVFDRERDAYGDFGPEHTNALAVDRPRAPYSGGPAGPTGSDLAAGPPPARSRRGPVLLALTLAVALIAGVGGWYFGIARYTSAPGLINLTPAGATARLRGDGLSLRVVGYIYSGSISRGRVVSSDPSPGGRVLKHGTVSVELSKGPNIHAVPSLHGVSLDRAQLLLRRDSLGYGHQVLRWSGKVAQGLVIGTDPAAGARLRGGTRVDVVVSRGPRPIHVPNLTGDRGSHAIRALHRLGFVPAVTRAYDDNVPHGLVISQTPSSGTRHKGDRIGLRISRGPHLVTIPDETSSGVASARAGLESLGFHVVVRHSSVYIGLGYVLRQSPGGGARAPYGSTVYLYLV